MDVYVIADRVGKLAELRQRVARWDASGVAGVLFTDHLFFAADGRDDFVRPPDPIVAIAAIGAMSDQLVVGTIVANVGLLHPVLMIRHFAQLAELLGSDRVLAGLGAGWNGAEFAALGAKMPSHGTRLERLAETAQLWRQLFAHGTASVAGVQVTVSKLPLAPRPDRPPRLMLGGGSRRLLELAGSYADHVDLNGSPRARRLPSLPQPHDDLLRRLSTTIADLEEAGAVVDAAAAAAGRSCDEIKRSIIVDVLGEETVALRKALEETGSTVDTCPYVLPSQPAAMAAAIAERGHRLRLSVLVTPEGPHVAAVAAAAAKLENPLQGRAARPMSRTGHA